jgi:hypothetical protein
MVALALGALTLGRDGEAADDPSFGPNDVPTVFFISKSDDQNRVDYGMRLDGRCAPVNDDAVFPYWREFEKAPPVRTHGLGMFEYVAYGMAEQRTVRRDTSGGEQRMRLKQLDRKITVTTRRGEGGRCASVAHATIGGVSGAILNSVYVKLGGPLSVDYIDVHGTNPDSGAAVTERIRK